jgi:hypothetical protein
MDIIRDQANELGNNTNILPYPYLRRKDRYKARHILYIKHLVESGSCKPLFFHVCIGGNHWMASCSETLSLGSICPFVTSNRKIIFVLIDGKGLIGRLGGESTSFHAEPHN